MKKQFIRFVRTFLILTSISIPGLILAQTNMGLGNFNDCGPNDYYDTGGSATNYGDGESIVETYCGAQPGDCIQFDFQLWDILSRDALTIYDGPSTASPQIGFFDDANAPGLIVATTGCLTFEWNSNANGNSAGWHAIYSCTPCAGATCSDGIQNQGETGVDCGGPCPPCSSTHNIGDGNYNSCTGTLYDSGGSAGQYGNSEYFSETYCPDNPDDCIFIDFTAFNTEGCCDFLNIYEGSSIFGTLIGSYSGTNSPGIISSTTGCVTFEWYSDGSITYDGWAANITCGACPSCTDGILNGQEIGIDCGGPDCPACPCSSLPVYNDEACCAYSTPVNPYQSCASVTAGTVSGATASFNANTCFGTADDDVWFSFVATNATHYIDLINVVGSTTDLYHSVYAGTCNSIGAPLICSDPNSSVVSGLVPGNTYYIRVYTWTSLGGQTTSFDVCVSSPPPPPPNDDPCNAIPANVNPDAVCNLLNPGYCTGSTSSMPGCLGTADDDVWFSFTALSTEHDISLLNATGTTDLVHEVFSGTCNSLTSINCSDPNNSSLSGLTVGNTYFIRIYTWSSSGLNTSFDLCITSPCGLVNDPPDCGLNYTHSMIPYAPVPYNTGTTYSLTDDSFAPTFSSIGFDFCFDGVVYNDVMISSNGYLIFPGCYSSHNGNEVTPSGYSPYSISQAIPNSTNAPQNAILAPWQDINPNVGGIIRSDIVGTAPNRIFIAKFESIGMFGSSCTGLAYTAQVMLFETTNNIEIHIGEKAMCTGWNSGAAILGLNNYDGTTAVSPAGYNYPTQWTVSSAAPEGHRFTCDCDPAICQILLANNLLEFNAIEKDNYNQLDWVMEKETEVDHYVIERSLNAYNFTELESMEVNSNNASIAAHQFLDRDIHPGTAYYRIRIVGKDGKQEYSRIVSINRKDQNTFRVYPNPVDGNRVKVEFDHATVVTSFDLINSIGQSFEVEFNQLNAYSYQIDSKSLNSGQYLIRIHLEGGRVLYKKLIKN